MKETVKTLFEKIKKLEDTASNLQVTCGTVWNAEQIKQVIEENNTQNRLIKMEITKGFFPGGECFEYIILKYPPIL